MSMLRGHQTIQRLTASVRRNWTANKEEVSRREVVSVEEDIENKEIKCSSSPCPICQVTILGGNDAINIHIDRCLEKGLTAPDSKKRRSNQLTIAEIWAKSPAKVAKTEPMEGNFELSERELSNDAIDSDSKVQDCYFAWEKFTKQEAYDCSKPLAHQHSKSLTTNCECSCHGGSKTEPPSVKTETKSEPIDPPAEQKSAEADSRSNVDPVFRDPLQTFIVGRKYNKQVPCKEGTEVTAVREKGNQNDENAIQVVLSNELDQVLGHLPRQLAAKLAPLMDETGAKIKGNVTQTPENENSRAPISLRCQLASSCTHPGHEGPCQCESNHSLLDRAVGQWLSAQAESELEAHTDATMAGSSYRKNFLWLLDSVMASKDGELFTEEENATVCLFQTLPEDCQNLFIRLFQRKGPWFRASFLSYSDVRDTEAAIETLSERGFLNVIFKEPVPDRQLSSPNVLALLTVADLKSLLVTSGIQTKKDVLSKAKQELLAMAKSSSKREHPCPITDRQVAALCGPCVRLSPQADKLFRAIQRVFFLNEEQDLSAFLLADMGARKYAKYNVSHFGGSVFPSRKALQEYQEALELAAQMDQAVQSCQLELSVRILQESLARLAAAGKGPFLQTGSSSVSLPDSATCHSFGYRFTAAYVHTCIGTLGVSLLERERRYKEAIACLRELLSCGWGRSRRGFWTVRLAMDLDHLGCKSASLAAAEAGLGDPWVRSGDLVALMRRVAGLAKPPRRYKRPPFLELVKRPVRERRILGRPLNSERAKSRFYGYDDSLCSVESLALQHYALGTAGGFTGTHSEGGVWRTLFGLLFWDALFCDVASVFRTPFQTAPLDLFTDSFYPSRRSLIHSRLEQVRAGSAPVLIAHRWALHKGTLCSGVNWERHSLFELQTIAACIGGSGLAAVMSLLAEDYSGWSAGMPDLLIWRVESWGLLGSQKSDCEECSCSGLSWSTVKGEARLVEVKGPRDRLSEQQRAWIMVLEKGGLDVEVCKVVEKEEEL